MVIDKGSFLLALAALGVGGAGGYVASREGVLEPSARERGVTERQALESTVQTTGTTAAPAATAPVCDDMTGAPGTCPAPGYPAEEGQGCGPLATKRCEDFKQAMKPRVAEQAVACLNGLTPAQRCDAARVNLCGHVALMNACSEADATQASGAGGSVGRDDLGSRCDAIVRGCPGATLAPTMRECRETLAGLSALGRDKMAACMSAHCGDKGLIGCEGVIDPK
jgi:hypothetical protein